MISYILPFYDKLKLFKLTYPLNLMYQHPEAEVICVLDDPAEEFGVLQFVKAHPETKFRVIVNDRIHDWRPPCSAYNVGIRNALGTHCALLDAETIITIPTPEYFWDLIGRDFRRAYAGVVWHVTAWEPDETPNMFRRRILATEAKAAPTLWGFGFLLVHRYELVSICGFDERRTLYGFDDDDIRNRLTRFGVVTEIDPMIRGYHLYHTDVTRERQEDPTSPSVVIESQNETWGKEFSRIAFDWKPPTI